MIPDDVVMHYWELVNTGTSTRKAAVQVGHSKTALQTSLEYLGIDWRRGKPNLRRDYSKRTEERTGCLDERLTKAWQSKPLTGG